MAVKTLPDALRRVLAVPRFGNASQQSVAVGPFHGEYQGNVRPEIHRVGHGTGGVEEIAVFLIVGIPAPERINFIRLVGDASRRFQRQNCRV